MNKAQKLLSSLGGVAKLVAGYNKHYWSDAQTPKRERSKPRGQYGAGLQVHFDLKRAAGLPRKTS